MDTDDSDEELDRKKRDKFRGERTIERMDINESPNRIRHPTRVGMRPRKEKVVNGCESSIKKTSKTIVTNGDSLDSLNIARAIRFGKTSSPKVTVSSKIKTVNMNGDTSNIKTVINPAGDSSKIIRFNPAPARDSSNTISLLSPVIVDRKTSYWKLPKIATPATETGRINWDSINDELALEEEVQWIPPEVSEPLDHRVLSSGRKLGTKQDDYDCTADTAFVSSHIMLQLLESKISLHKINDLTRLEARMKSNPFETIRSGIFMNRAAMKMANIDSVLGFALTQPITEGGEPFVKGNELLYFADICAGPGGFSEYILWRKKWEARGFGFTLKGEENDFNLDDFIAGPPESFETHYGQEENGNILNPANVSSFISHVLSCTDNKGCHFIMADGGFAVDGIEDKQELLSKSLVLSQFLVALAIVRPGGHFICKIFDAFTPFSVGLIYIMYRCFDLVAIHKPNSSRPANSERYIFCKWKRDQTEGARAYLAECQEMLWKWSKSTKDSRDILNLVSMDILTKEDHPFFKYIYNSNNSMGIRQIKSLKKLFAFCKHPALLETRQIEARAFCFEAWGIPDEKRKKEVPELPLARFALYKGSYLPGLLTELEKDLTLPLMEQVFKSPYDWRFVIVEGDQKRRNRGFYFGMGGTRVYRFDNFVWREVGLKFELSKDTCVFGEIVHEICRHTKAVKVSFYIIDALVLGGKDIRGCHYTLRHELCSKFAKAMDKPSRSDLISVRVKNLMRMESISEIFEKLTYREVKSNKDNEDSSKSKLACPINFTDEQSDIMHPTGVLFLKITKDPWIMALSRSANRKYCFNTMTNSSVFHIPESAVADFQYTLKNRVIWWWDKNTRISLINTLLDNPAVAPNNDKVHAGNMVRHIQSLLCHPR